MVHCRMWTGALRHLWTRSIAWLFIVLCCVYGMRKKVITSGIVMRNSFNIMHTMTPPHGNAFRITRPLWGKPRVIWAFQLQWACDLLAWTSCGVNSGAVGDLSHLDAHMTSLTLNLVLLMIFSISRALYNIIAAYELENTFQDSVPAICFIYKGWGSI